MKRPGGGAGRWRLVVFGGGLVVGLAAGLLRRRPSPLSPEGAREPSSPDGDVDDAQDRPGPE